MVIFSLSTTFGRRSRTLLAIFHPITICMDGIYARVGAFQGRAAGAASARVMLVGKIYDRVVWQGSRAESGIHAKCIGWRNAGMRSRSPSMRGRNTLDPVHWTELPLISMNIE